jgi:predicted ATPase
VQDISVKIAFLPNPSAKGVTIQENKLSFTQGAHYTFFIDKEISEGIMRMYYLFFLFFLFSTPRDVIFTGSENHYASFLVF